MMLFWFIENTTTMFYTYILYSKTADKFYIGMSESPEERLKKHQTKHKGFTNISSDWKIVFTREFTTKTEALSFEKKIKSWKSRKMIQVLIDSQSK
jgi:putative endonuclease